MGLGREEAEGRELAGARPVLLTIAGFDPSSGAGITADLKVFAASGVFGVSCITALTVQSTQGVRRVEALSGPLITATLDCLHDDFRIAGVKIGMLATKDNVSAAAEYLERSGVARNRIVLDPVLVSSSGASLLEETGIVCLRERLLPRVGWITPNLDELAVLTGRPSVSREQIPDAADRLREIAAQHGNPELNVLVTGGHLERPDDYLLSCDSAAGMWISGERIETSATHGTGCALSSALLCGLLDGRSKRDAVTSAKRYVEESMRRAYKVGKGRGPMHHLHRLDVQGSTAAR